MFKLGCIYWLLNLCLRLLNWPKHYQTLQNKREDKLVSLSTYNWEWLLWFIKPGNLVLKCEG